MVSYAFTIQDAAHTSLVEHFLEVSGLKEHPLWSPKFYIDWPVSNSASCLSAFGAVLRQKPLTLPQSSFSLYLLEMMNWGTQTPLSQIMN